MTRKEKNLFYCKKCGNDHNTFIMRHASSGATNITCTRCKRWWFN